MIIKASTKAEIRLIKASRGRATIEVIMPDKPDLPIRHTLREGEVYFNTVTMDVELPGPNDRFTTYEVRT